MSWWYKEEELKEVPENYYGFVYLITDSETGMKYVGKKFFWNKKILPITKTRKRRKRTLVESDWISYYGSSPHVRELIEDKGVETLTREILHLCKTRGDCAYYETKEQFDREVLLRDDYYNGIINCRISRSHLSANK